LGNPHTSVQNNYVLAGKGRERERESKRGGREEESQDAIKK
jgi:hypothetical protein